jgi:glutathione peroxidase
MSMGNQIPNWSKTNCKNIPMKKSLFEFTVKNLKEEEVSLEKYRGYDALLVVNTASLCGLTKTQYTGLEKLREELQKHGKFEILGFPCSQFKNQEPGSADEIMQCVSQFNVKFPLFEKTYVNGPNTHEIFTFLKSASDG